MIRREGERMYVAGPVTLQNVTGLLREGIDHVRDGVCVVDLSEVSGLDSSLLAALLAWIREARDRNSSPRRVKPSTWPEDAGATLRRRRAAAGSKPALTGYTACTARPWLYDSRDRNQ